MARDFDGVDDLINCGTGSSIANIFAGGGHIHIVIAPDSDGESNNGMICHKRTGDGWQFLVTAEAAGFVKMQFLQGFNTTDGFWTTNSAVVPVDGSYTTIDLFYDSDNVSNNPIFYVNGSITANTEGQTPVGTAADDSAEQLTIGNTNAGSLTFEGDIAFCVMWTGVTPSANEITVMSNGVNPFAIQPDSQVLFTPIWGNQSPEPDYSGNGNTGAVTGAVRSAGPSMELLGNYL